MGARKAAQFTDRFRAAQVVNSPARASAPIVLIVRHPALARNVFPASGVAFASNPSDRQNDSDQQPQQTFHVLTLSRSLSGPQVWRIIQNEVGMAFKSLKGQLLLDNGRLNGSFFHRTVLLICQHDENGAFGLMINRPTGSKVGDA